MKYDEFAEKVLIGERIRLRQICVEDASRIVDLVNANPEIVANFAFFQEPLTLEREKDYLARMIESPNDIVFVIISADGDELLGTCGLHDIDRNNNAARLGYILFNKKVHGMGIAGEAVNLILKWAFEYSGMNKVYLNVLTGNIGGIKTDLSNGFQFEGRLRDYYRIGTRYIDVYHMGILKKEWQIR